MGIPTPEIVWRLNWGHVPEKCTMTSTPLDGNRAYGECNNGVRNFCDLRETELLRDQRD